MVKEYEDEDLEEEEQEEYDGKLVTQSSEPTIEGLYNSYKRGRLILQPDFQRDFVWDSKRASKLVESVLIGAPIPIIYLSESKDGIRSVIDGQQRLTSLFQFKDEQIKLSSTIGSKEYRNKTYMSLDIKSQEKIDNYPLKVVTIHDDKSDPNLKFSIFERLNKGSVALNEMELRNCIYFGEYMNLIKDLSKDENFRKLLNQTEKHPRMLDFEYVLRFAAFYHGGYLSYKSSMKAFLNNDMEQYRNISEKDSKNLIKAFKNSTSLIYTLFTGNAFKRFQIGDERNVNGKFGKQINNALFDVIMWYFHDKTKNQIMQCSDSIREAIVDLISTNQEFINTIEMGTSSKKQITKRFDIFREHIDKVLTENSKKQVRCFSLELKEKLFNTNSTCTICNQKIHELDDSHIDHIQQYWLGGETIESNARLTHRYCNLSRSKKH